MPKKKAWSSLQSRERLPTANGVSLPTHRLYEIPYFQKGWDFHPVTAYTYFLTESSFIPILDLILFWAK
jgi:hypothetical protein